MTPINKQVIGVDFLVTKLSDLTRNSTVNITLGDCVGVQQ